MEAVFFLIAVLFLAYLGDEKKMGKKAVIFRVLLILVLSFLPWVSGELSTDHAGYADDYKSIGRMSNLGIESVGDFLFGRMTEGEYGFVVLCRLLNKIGISTSGFFLVIAILTNTFLVKSYYRFNFPVFTFFLLLCSAHYLIQSNLVRQILAVSIVLFNLKYAVEKDWKTYLLICVIAFTIHHSSIVSLLFLPFCFFDGGYQYMKWLFAGLWIISVLIAFGVVFLDLTQLNLLAGATEGYDFYLNSENGIGTSNESFGYVYNFLIILLFLFYKGEGRNIIYAYVFVLGAVFSNLSVAIPNLFRVSLYFSATYPFFVPYILSNMMSNRKLRLPIQGLTVIIVLYYIRTYFLLMSSADYFSVL